MNNHNNHIMCNIHTKFSSINSRSAILITFLSMVSLLIKFNMATAHNVTSMIKCIETEREALFAFKQGLKDPSNRLSSWTSNGCCQWSGVQCNKISRHVIKLYLRNPFPSSKSGTALIDQGESIAYERRCLGGDINSSLLDLKYLQYLDLSLNDFKGTPIPEFIGMLKNLRYLNLSSASFSGEIPSLLGNLSDLNLLDLYSEIYGLKTINLRWVSVLDISINSFNSSIPHWMFYLTRLRTLDLNSNHFQGQIPRYLGNLCNLKFLDLSGNNFSGSTEEIFSGFLDCSNNSLVSLDLSGNSLGGELPNSLEILENLQQLGLSSNSFWGTIPTSIGHMSSLQYLDLGSNNMNGTIPGSFGKLSKLVQLDLKGNPQESVIIEIHLMNLTGLEDIIIIPPETKTPLVFNVRYEWVPPFRLKSLYLENCLVGPRFSLWLQVQSELTVATLKNVGIKDNLPEEWLSKISAQLTYLDLSNNQIKEKLPKKLKSLILDEVSQRRLETLDHWKHLIFQTTIFRGPIPQSISCLTFLSHLNLSHNNLSGRIPLGNQLQTLDDSSIYANNPLLCGFLLPTWCPGDEDHTSSSSTSGGGGSEDNGAKNDNEMLWFYVSMGFGFLVGLCGVCFSLWIKVSWRKAYFRFVRTV
ncbi:hypothetical protein ACSBR2_012762 [Camellia fascicularis]